MRTRAIVNPRACHRRAAQAWPELERKLRARLGAVEATFTEHPKHATELTRAALREGVEQIVAVGGDGTVNEVVNGFFDGGEPINPDAVLALLMQGTGGDFRKTFQISDDDDEVIDRIVDGVVKPIDLGRVALEGLDSSQVVRYFDNVGSFGASGKVVDAVAKAKLSRLLGGKFAYNWASFTTMLRHQNQQVRVRVDDAYDETIGCSLVAVCNGQFFGGGMWVGPHAQPDDGLFDVVLMRDLSLMDFIRGSGALYRGKHLENPKIDSARGRHVEAIPAPGATEVLVELDGELTGRLPATFDVVPAALKLRC